MKTIYKYELKLVEEQTLMIPALDLQKLKLETIDNVPYLWCVVDTSLKERPYYIKLIGTGCEIMGADFTNYLGSVNIKNGRKNYVWHYFRELRNEKEIKRLKKLGLKKTSQNSHWL